MKTVIRNNEMYHLLKYKSTQRQVGKLQTSACIQAQNCNEFGVTNVVN